MVRTPALGTEETARSSSVSSDRPGGLSKAQGGVPGARPAPGDCPPRTGAWVVPGGESEVSVLVD